jgi:hypothetical protein
MSLLNSNKKPCSTGQGEGAAKVIGFKVRIVRRSI